MREKQDRLSRIAGRIDDAISLISPQRALNRRMARFSYDALDNRRQLTDRSISDTTADNLLTEKNQSMLRAIAYDLAANNPLVKGILLTEADDVIGTRLNIQARSEDEGFNQEAEAAFREEMMDMPCDITGRFNFIQIMHKSFLNYRTAGDFFWLLLDNYQVQLCEGSQCGTPLGQKPFDNFDVHNGVAVSKKTGKVIGYYIGKPNKWGYIDSSSWKKYGAEKVAHIFNPDRVTYTRGEPVLTSSVNAIKSLWRYWNDEIDAASLNALLATFVTVSSPNRVPNAYTYGRYPGGQTENYEKVQKIEPFMVHYLNQDEGIHTIKADRPPQNFDQLCLRFIMLAAKPLCMPLMIATGDLSGATFMNARIANQHWKKNLEREQAHVVKPKAALLRNLWLAGWMKREKIKNVPDRPFRCEVICQKQEYVDPVKEATADKVELESGATIISNVLEKKGVDPREYFEKQVREKKLKEEIYGKAGYTEADFEPIIYKKIQPTSNTNSEAA
jgi:capsid protein